MINIAICDDESLQVKLNCELLRRYIEKHPQYQINIVSFSEPLELLTYVEKHRGFDIYLLDVYMSDMLGTEAARELRKLSNNGEIIFITSSKDHAIDAFKVDASQYLIKPYIEKNVFAALDKVFSRVKIERRHIITLKTSEGIVCLQARYVIYTVTGRNNYQIIHTINGEKMEVRMTTTELFELLCQTKSFVRCGAALNLNLKYIKQIKSDVIVLDSGDQLSYPYRAYKKLKVDFLSYQMFAEE